MAYESRADEALRELKRRHARVAVESARAVKEEIVKVVRTDAPEGRRYFSPELNRVYRASRPGEPPAEKTGAYLGSFEVAGPVIGSLRVTAAVTNDETTEDGTTRLWAVLEYRMGRPHVRPARDAVADRVAAAARRRSGGSQGA